MIHDGSTLGAGGRLEVDLCVVGSGPGGASVATIAAEAGMKVLLLEAGPLVTPGEMNQRESTMLPRLLWEAGARANADQSLRIVQGRGVGGSSLHNLNLCKRIPEAILADWQASRGLEHLPLATWRTLYAEVEELLAVAPVPEAAVNRHNQLLRRGSEHLGWRGGLLSHNRSGCVGSGYCELGCSYDAKNNALKVLVPRLVAAGGVVLTHAQAVRVTHRGGAAVGVEAVLVDERSRAPRGRLEVTASHVCLSASATGTPALLSRSRVPDPGGETGRRLRVHPALMVAGEFDEEVRAWEGIPQSYECVEWLDLEHPGDPEAGRLWIVPAFGHPASVSAMLSGHGAAHEATMRRYARLACFTAMLHDRSAGVVAPAGDLGLAIDLWPEADDRRQLALGMIACARLLLAAGARRVLVPGYPGAELSPGDDPEALGALPIERGRIDLVAAHPLGSVPMGDDPRVAAVGSDGRHHHLERLWLADGSLFPSSIGVPPQLSIYALGHHVGRRIVAAG